MVIFLSPLILTNSIYAPPISESSITPTSSSFIIISVLYSHAFALIPLPFCKKGFLFLEQTRYFIMNYERGRNMEEKETESANNLKFIHFRDSLVVLLHDDQKTKKNAGIIYHFFFLSVTCISNSCSRFKGHGKSFSFVLFYLFYNNGLPTIFFFCLKNFCYCYVHRVCFCFAKPDVLAKNGN